MNRASQQQAAEMEDFTLDCPICKVETMACPVTTMCGHSFCKACINLYWDNQEISHGGVDYDIYNCPMCRTAFPTRPALAQSITLMEIIGIHVRQQQRRQQQPPPVPLPPPPRRRRRHYPIVRDTMFEVVDCAVDYVITETSRAQYLHHHHSVCLNDQTSNLYACLRDGNTTMSFSGIPVVNHSSNRFFQWCQAVDTVGLLGQHYWEVVKQNEVCIAVSYGFVNKATSMCGFGLNDTSWGLHCMDDKYMAIHNKEGHFIDKAPVSNLLGIYLDYPKGYLAFFAIQGNKSILIYEYTQQRFTRALHPGAWVSQHGKVTFI